MSAQELKQSNMPQESGSVPQVDTGLALADLKSVLEVQGQTEISRLNSTITACEADIRRARESFISANSKLQETLGLRNAVMSSDRSEEMVVRMHAHLAGLVSAGKYAQFNTEGNYLIGQTTRITHKHKGTLYDFGTFKVKVNYKKSSDSGNSGWVTFIGSIIRDGYCHPHIHADGSACFGNIDLDVATQAKNREFGVLFDLMYDYLCSYTDKSGVGVPYRTITYWPIVSGRKLKPEVPKVITNDAESVVVAVPIGRFSRLAQQEVRHPQALGSLHGLDLGLVDVIERLGFDLTEYERVKLSALRSNDSAYERRLKYYVNWVGKKRGVRLSYLDTAIDDVLSGRRRRGL